MNSLYVTMLYIQYYFEYLFVHFYRAAGTAILQVAEEAAHLLSLFLLLR